MCWGEPQLVFDDHMQLHASLESLATAGHGPGLFGLVRQHGSDVFSGTVGVADLKAPRSIAATDRFRVGSITKIYVAALVLRLAADGTLSTRDRVAPLLPAYDLHPGLTVEDLLRLRSGIPDYVDPLIGNPVTLERARQVYGQYHRPSELINLALTQPEQLEPGARFRYSNTDYLLLGLIVERTTGERLDVVLRRRILGPLELRDTDMPVADPVIRGPHATGYTRLRSSEPYIDTTEITPSESWASGAIVSTPHDVAAFMESLMSRDLVPSEQLTMMRNARPITEQRGYGCGLFRWTLPDGRMIFGHTGGTAGFNSVVVWSEDGRCVVLYQNSYDTSAHLPWDNKFTVAALAPEAV